MKHLDLFSGIGGFALAVETVWPDAKHTFCDNEPFAQAVLHKHWPNAQIHGDIKTLKPTPADIVTGGFPCQPFSSAGPRRGKEDDRHLWPEMLRVIRESAPRWVIGENVSGLLTWNGGVVLDEVHADLEAEGYEVWSFIIPAISLNAPHRRDRVWIIANRKNRRRRGWSINRRQVRKGEFLSGEQEDWSTLRNQTEGCCKNLLDAPNSSSERQSGQRKYQRSIYTKENKDWQANSSSSGNAKWNENWPEVATRLCSVDDGLPNGLARPRGWRNAALKGAGNAIVPQVAIQIMKAIKAVDKSL